MYKTKVFNTLYELTEFLNSNCIDEEDIVHISIYQHGVALIWITRG